MTTAYTPDVISTHGLTTDEYEKIVRILGQAAELTELGIFSVMWSEHCSYKSSRLHLKKLPTRSKLVLQGPGENAGIIDIGQGWGIAFKIESHNHPSFIEPFRERQPALAAFWRTSSPWAHARWRVGRAPIRFAGGCAGRLRNGRIVEGVVAGISHYGNCFGVPTIGGETVFESCFNGNPRERVRPRRGSQGQGLLRKGLRSGQSGDLRRRENGRDGIHGASMASAEFTEESQQKRPNVQMGDPFMEKPCSRRVSKRWRPERSSAFRTWAPRV